MAMVRYMLVFIGRPRAEKQYTSTLVIQTQTEDGAIFSHFSAVAGA